MIPDPLHPSVVHFPIVLALLLPVVAAVALLALHRGASRRAAWLPVVAVAGLLALSAWVAVETGENEEEAVERVVTESAIHEHEERAEVFLPLTIVALVITLAGLSGHRAAGYARGAAVVAAVVVAGAATLTGHSGGLLVYQHGAASAYTTGGGARATGDDREVGGERDDEDDDHDGRRSFEGGPSA